MRYVKFSKDKVFSVLKEQGVPEHLHQEAYMSIKEGWDVANSFKCKLVNLSAPIVVPIALLFTKWESESLPKVFDLWNNDTNLNGDRIVPAPLDKNSKEAIEACYYNKGKHPRSWMSRYIWLGLRNRGKKSYMKPVKDDSLEQEEIVWGTDNLTRGDKDNPPVTGWTVVKLGSYWQMIGCLDTGFKGYFQEPKWGWKTGLSQSLFERYGSGLVMAVGHNLKLRKRAD